MSPQSKAVLDAALDLSQEERAELAEQLLESIDLGLDEAAESAWIAELECRVRELESGAVKSVPWLESRAKLQRTQDGQGD